MSARGPAWELATFDIDGTLTIGHGWAFLAERRGRRGAFDATQRRFRRGEIDEDRHLADLLTLADGLTRAELDRLLEATPRLRGISAMVSAWHARGTRVALLSHNPVEVIDWYRRRFGFDGGAGPELAAGSGDRLAYRGPVHPDKVAALTRLCDRWSVALHRVIHVGDGRADARVFDRVGAGVALNSTDPEVRRRARLVLKTTDLRGLPGRLGALAR